MILAREYSNREIYREKLFWLSLWLFWYEAYSAYYCKVRAKFYDLFLRSLKN